MKKETKFLILGCIYTIIFILLAWNVSQQGMLTIIDSRVNAEVPTIQNPFFTFIATVTAYLFDTIALGIYTILIAAFLYWRKWKKDALLFAAVMFITAAAIEGLKIFFARARPENALLAGTTKAFPSGHATAAVVFFMLLLYFAIEHKKKENWIFIATPLLILFIGFTRIYLNVHWLTDVLGGFALGLAIISFAWSFKHALLSKL